MFCLDWDVWVELVLWMGNERVVGFPEAAEV